MKENSKEVPMKYLAHLSEDGTREQSILEHAVGTAKLAGDFAAAFQGKNQQICSAEQDQKQEQEQNQDQNQGQNQERKQWQNQKQESDMQSGGMSPCQQWGYNLGLLHDIGKYTQKFQARLHGGAMTDHATAGARELLQLGNHIGAYCISGHHSGLLDGGGVADTAGMATLKGRMQKKLEDYQEFQREISIPEFPPVPLKVLGKGGFTLSFFIRMLFSGLVDADYLDTEAFMANGTEKRDVFDSMDALYERLYRHIEPWLKNADNSTINGRRTAILKACLEKGKGAPGLYLLTVPTGGGKTISSLAFAFQHAKEHHLDRIIYVIPYTSIIEQNAQVFRDILGDCNVLEDHCNVVYEDLYEDYEDQHRIQLASENWACPVVVTTNVQFFESLFACKTSKCRKLHNIANSVIIFDEAQMLPVNYLKPCVQAISELVCNYHSTAVLCTATQPSLKQFFPPQMSISEICPDVKDQYDFFRRTVLKNIGQITEEELAERLRMQDQVLCILNTRKRVQRVFDALKEEEGTFHLSTFMYPKHRKRLMLVIRKRLKEGKACRLIATSLVEAGVDFDFPTVYRELAGVDSVIQAAGRCNREGKRRPEASETVVFTMEKDADIHIPNALKLPVQVAEQVAEQQEDLASLEAIEAYFNRLYQFRGETGLDTKEIVRQMEDAGRSRLLPFATVAKQFKLIENETRTILIDLEPEAKAIAERIRRGEISRSLVRDAGQYCINIYENDFEKLNGAGRLEAIDGDFFLLRNKEQYTEEKGLEIQVDRGEAVLF